MKTDQYLRSLVGRTLVLVVCMCVVGCSGDAASPKPRNVIGQGVALVGTLVVMIPHPITKVIGVVLIASGSALCIEAQMEDGTVQQIHVHLDAGQKADAAKGAGVEVRAPGGKVFFVTVHRK